MMPTFFRDFMAKTSIFSPLVVKNVGISSIETKQSSLSTNVAPKGGPSGITRPRRKDARKALKPIASAMNPQDRRATTAAVIYLSFTGLPSGVRWIAHRAAGRIPNTMKMVSSTIEKKDPKEVLNDFVVAKYTTYLTVITDQ